MSEYVPDAVYGDRTREEMEILARQGGARRKAIEKELREREAANVLANLAAADSQFEMEPTIGGDSQWQSFVDETPGSARQAQYNPEGYAMQRETVAEGRREQAQEELVMYGTGSDLTPAQQQNRMDRRDTDDRRRHQPHVEEQRIARMAARAGITMAEARKMVNDGYQSAGEDRQMHAGSRMVVGQPNVSPPPSSDYARDAYQGLRDAGTDQRLAAGKARKTEVAKRAQLLLNPMSYLDRDDISPEQRHVASVRLIGPKAAGPSPSEVEKAHNEQLMALGLRAAQGQRDAGDSDTAVVLEERRRADADSRMRAGRQAASVVLSYADRDPVRRRQAASEILVRGGYSSEEIDLILRDVFGNAAPAPEPPPATPGYPGGAGDMGQGFSG